ncbi:hypothetical protein Glove_245g11 [Diversispora epigaea]|uniref:Uncharacterized protein n=1 Tax=Diversispora epigaea TaxID=1348612 RepID=A0A397IED5_9GLOM|nr:hypothetical protein Glove_245g11 [Diversispora epigaea]
MSTQSEHNTPTVSTYTKESEIRYSVLSDVPTEIPTPKNLEQYNDYASEDFEILKATGASITGGPKSKVRPSRAEPHKAQAESSPKT